MNIRKLLQLPGILAAIAATATASADVVTWTGGNGGYGYQWLATCWDTGALPGADDEARFVDIPIFKMRFDNGQVQSIGLTADQTISGLVFTNRYPINVQGGGHTLFLDHIRTELVFEPTTNVVSVQNLAFKADTNMIETAAGHAIQVKSRIQGMTGSTNHLVCYTPGGVILEGYIDLAGDFTLRDGYAFVNGAQSPTFKGNLIVGGTGEEALLELGPGVHNNPIQTYNDLRILPGGRLVFPERAATRSLEFVAIDHGTLDFGGGTISTYNHASTERTQEVHFKGGVFTNGTLNLAVFHENPAFFVHAADRPSILAGTLMPISYPGLLSVEDGSAPIDFMLLGAIEGSTPFAKLGHGAMLIDAPAGTRYYVPNGKKTEVREGTLVIDNQSGTAFGTNNVLVKAGATLGGDCVQVGGDVSGVLRGNIEIVGDDDSPATLCPGTLDRETGEWIPGGAFRVGNESQTNNVAFGANSRLLVHAARNGVCSRLDVRGAVSLAADAALVVAAPASGLSDVEHTLVTFTEGLTGRFATAETESGDDLSSLGRLEYRDAQGEVVTGTGPITGGGSVILAVKPAVSLIIIR